MSISDEHCAFTLKHIALSVVFFLSLGVLTIQKMDHVWCHCYYIIISRRNILNLQCQIFSTNDIC
jgi:hypothetical protein